MEDIEFMQLAPDSSHSSKAPLQCRICSRRFVKTEHLVRHVRSHTKERPFKCSDCGNRYGRQDVLVRHRRRVQCKRPHAENLPAVDQGPQNFQSAELMAEVLGRGTSNSLPVIPVVGQHQENAIQAEAAPVQMVYNVFPSHSDRTNFTSTIPLLNLNVPESNNINPLPSDTDQTGDASVLSASFPGFSEFLPAWNIDQDLQDDILGTNFTPVDSRNWVPEPNSTELEDMELIQALHVQQIWFSQVPDTPANYLYTGSDSEHLPCSNSEYASPLSESTEIDEECRQTLRKRLQIISYEPAVPSQDVLNIWARLYFTKVHPLFPIIHAPTFRPSRANMDLLIAICAMGSLFTGSKQGTRDGIYLFERVRKATFLKWEQHFRGNQATIMPIIQSALLSKMFGILSGDPTILLAVDAFHGTALSFARRIRLHRPQPPFQIEPDAEGAHLDQLWREWGHQQELIRATHGLYIIDAELASILHREPMQSFDSFNFTLASSDGTFMALNARDWKAKYLVDNRTHPSTPDFHMLSEGPLNFSKIPTFSSFSAYVVLEGIGMQILSRRASVGPNKCCSVEFQQPLADFHRQFLARGTQSSQGPLQLSILWHAVCMTVFTDFGLLEQAVGCEGRKLTPLEYNAITTWAQSHEARKCIIHALLIRMHVQSGSIVSELAIHVPRAIFRAGIAIFCYLKYGSHKTLTELPCTSPKTTTIITSMGSPGITSSIDQDQTIFSDANYSIIGDITSLKMNLFTVTDLLQHIGHWEVARKFATILATLSSFAFDSGQVYSKPPNHRDDPPIQ